MTDINIEAMGEALYLISYPHLHHGRPPDRVWGDMSQWARDRWMDDAKLLVEMYRSTLVPVAERTLNLRDVNPELHEQIHGKR